MLKIFSQKSQNVNLPSGAVKGSVTVGSGMGAQFGRGSYSVVACSCWTGCSDAGGPSLSIFKDLGL